MPFMIEVIVYLTVITDKLLESGCCFETLYLSLLPWKRQVWILTSVIRSAAEKLSISNANLTKGCSIGRQLVCCNNLGRSVFSHCFYKKLLSCRLVASLCNIAFQNLTFMINSTPRVKAFSICFNENFVQMPLPVQMLTHPLLSNFGCKICTKPVHPKPYRFVVNIDSTFMWNIFNLAKT